MVTSTSPLRYRVLIIANASAVFSCAFRVRGRVRVRLRLTVRLRVRVRVNRIEKWLKRFLQRSMLAEMIGVRVATLRAWWLLLKHIPGHVMWCASFAHECVARRCA